MGVLARIKALFSNLDPSLFLLFKVLNLKTVKNNNFLNKQRSRGQ